MGVLDEAIREHLELKRSRGADPSEIERAEREALGPVRRAPEPAQLDEAEGDAELGPQHGGHAADYDAGVPVAEEEQYEEDGLYEDAAPVAPGAYAAAPAYEAPPAYEPELAYEPEPSGEPEKHHGDPLEQPTQLHPAPHPAPASAIPADQDEFEDPPAAGVAPGDHTVEYDAPVDHEAEPAKEGEDVLEETPEFLQDTPDHDRLWFEQRPPRDFDFEG